MRKLLSLALATACVLVPAALRVQAATRPAPELSIQQVDGPALRLSSYKGKIVAIAFLNTGCEHCQHFAQELSKLQQDYGPRGVQVLAVVFDNGAKAGLKNFKDRFVKGYPIGYSDEITVYNWLKQPVEEGAFVPIIAFIDRRGYIESQHLGDDMLFQDPDANIRRKLDSMLKGRR